MARSGPTVVDLVKRHGLMHVAYVCGVTPTAVTGWTRGAEPKARHLLKLAELAGIPTDPRLKRLAGLPD